MSNLDALKQLVEDLNLPKFENEVPITGCPENPIHYVDVTERWKAGWGYTYNYQYVVILPKLVVIKQTSENLTIECGYIMILHDSVIDNIISNTPLFTNYPSDMRIEKFRNLLLEKTSNVLTIKHELNPFICNIFKDVEETVTVFKAKESAIQFVAQSVEYDKFIVYIYQSHLRQFNSDWATILLENAILPKSTNIVSDIDKLKYVKKQSMKAKAHLKKNEVGKAKRHMTTIIELID